VNDLSNTYVNNEGEHSLTLVSRKLLKLSGVRQILNFDDDMVLFVTACGEREVTGEQLSIDLLDLDNGLASLSGVIGGINYLSERPKKKRWFRGNE